MSEENKASLLEAPVGKPNVLILGGVGFIGRNLVKYLIDNKLASKIRVADKAQPLTAYLSDDHKAAFDQKNIVEFKQADLSKDSFLPRVFDGTKFDVVINLAGETRFSLTEEVYKQNILDVVLKTAAEAKKQGIPRWVEVSTAHIYEPSSKKPATEGKTASKPWTTQAKFRLLAEEALAKIGPPAVVLRPAIVYGAGDLTGITPRISCAAVYQKLKEKMKFLWDKGLKINTVHVNDMCAAIWTAATKLQTGKLYNVADENDTDQGSLNAILGELFMIETGFAGTALSTMAKINMSGAAAYSNDKHVPVFSKLCQEHKILNTPVSPYIDKELLYSNSLFVDGKAITADSDFVYKHPKMTVDLVREQVNCMIKQEIFPNVL